MLSVHTIEPFFSVSEKFKDFIFMMPYKHEASNIYNNKILLPYAVLQNGTFVLLHIHLVLWRTSQSLLSVQQ